MALQPEGLPSKPERLVHLDSRERTVVRHPIRA